MTKQKIVDALIEYHDTYPPSTKSPYSHFETMYNMLIEEKIFNPSNIFESLGKLSLDQLKYLHTFYLVVDETPIVIPVKEECKILEFAA